MICFVPARTHVGVGRDAGWQHNAPFSVPHQPLPTTAEVDGTRLARVQSALGFVELRVRRETRFETGRAAQANQHAGLDHLPDVHKGAVSRQVPVAADRPVAVPDPPVVHVAERWRHMTPEERERFRLRVREWCGFDPAGGGTIARDGARLSY